MIRRPLILLFLLLMSAGWQIQAQVDVILNQHWAMPSLLNPASAGNTDYVRIMGGAFLQRLGIYHSPKNFMGVADMPFKIQDKRIGAGLIVNNKRFDLYNNILIGAQGNYQWKIKDSYFVAGVQLGYYHSKLRGSEVEAKEGNENLAGSGKDVKGGSFDLALGLRYNHPSFHLGLSGLHLTSPKIKLTENGKESTDERFIESKLPASFYFDAGGNIGIKNTLFKLQPSLLLGTDFTNFQALAELRATYNQLLTFGVDYRWKEAFGVLAGVSIKDFYIGYSWEYNYTKMAKGSAGNHELVVGYQFKLDLNKKNTYIQRSIRIM